MVQTRPYTRNAHQRSCGRESVCAFDVMCVHYLCLCATVYVCLFECERMCFVVGGSIPPATAIPARLAATTGPSYQPKAIRSRRPSGLLGCPVSSIRRTGRAVKRDPTPF